MADPVATKKTEVPAPAQAPKLVQESLKADLSFIDKQPRDPRATAPVDTQLYWYGALPAVGPVQTWTTDKRGAVVGGEPTSALNAWTHPERRPEWYGKCPWFQNITIRGLVFPAFTNYAQQSGFESPTQAHVFNVARAGAVGRFTKMQVDEFMFEAGHTMIRPALNPRAPHTAEIFRLVEYPPGSGTWVHPSQDPAAMVNVRTVWNPEIDRPVADYVYFIRIENEFQQQDLLSIMRNPLISLSGK